MAKSDDFKQELRSGNLSDAIKIAFGEAIELEITTWVATTEQMELAPEDTDQARPGHRMRTRINLVDGDIENEVGSQFLGNSRYAALKNFHLNQVQEGREIIRQNLASLRTLFGMLVEMAQPDFDAAVWRDRLESRDRPPRPVPQFGSSTSSSLPADQSSGAPALSPWQTEPIVQSAQPQSPTSNRLSPEPQGIVDDFDPSLFETAQLEGPPVTSLDAAALEAGGWTTEAIAASAIGGAAGLSLGNEILGENILFPPETPGAEVSEMEPFEGDRPPEGSADFLGELDLENELPNELSEETAPPTSLWDEQPSAEEGLPAENFLSELDLSELELSAEEVPPEAAELTDTSSESDLLLGDLTEETLTSSEWPDLGLEETAQPEVSDTGLPDTEPFEFENVEVLAEEEPLAEETEPFAALEDFHPFEQLEDTEPVPAIDAIEELEEEEVSEDSVMADLNAISSPPSAVIHDPWGSDEDGDFDELREEEVSDADIMASLEDFDELKEEEASDADIMASLEAMGAEEAAVPEPFEVATGVSESQAFVEEDLGDPWGDLDSVASAANEEANLGDADLAASVWEEPETPDAVSPSPAPSETYNKFDGEETAILDNIFGDVPLTTEEVGDISEVGLADNSRDGDFDPDLLFTETLPEFSAPARELSEPVETLPPDTPDFLADLGSSSDASMEMPESAAPEVLDEATTEDYFTENAFGEADLEASEFDALADLDLEAPEEPAPELSSSDEMTFEDLADLDLETPAETLPDLGSDEDEAIAALFDETLMADEPTAEDSAIGEDLDPLASLFDGDSLSGDGDADNALLNWGDSEALGNDPFADNDPFAEDDDPFADFTPIEPDPPSTAS